MVNLRARSRSWYEAVRSSYWFVPTLMALAAVALSFAMISLDQNYGADWLGDGVWRYTGSADGARTLLGAIASSMIGLAGVVFSINIVALTLASGQFGSRLLRNFMSDEGNQVTLGTFVAGFLYSLMILRTIHGSDDSGLEAFLPQLSILVAVLLALAGLAVLIYFIHHAAESIQAPNVIESVADDLRHAIEHIYPDPLDQTVAPPETPSPLPDGFLDDAVEVEARRGGYLQRIELDQIVERAAERDLVVRVEHRPGQYVQRDSVVMRAWPAGRVDEGDVGHLRGTFTVGSQRSLAQDAGFAIEQLVEVAVRALSPGINDPFTAMQCVDRLGEGLSILAGRAFPPRALHDDDGRLRVIRYEESFGRLLDLAFNQIRQYARNSLDVLLRMLEALRRVGEHVRRPEDRDAFQAHVAMVYAQALRICDADRDRGEIESRHAVIHTRAAARAPSQPNPRREE